MRFTIPQFIEHEARIVGPLTFKQFVIIGAAGGLCFFLYFSIGKTNFPLFFLLSILIFGSGLSLAFLKIGGQNLSNILINFLGFSLAPKIYLWKKKETPITVFKKIEIKKKQDLPLKIAERSQLKKIRNEIEMKTK